MRLQLYCARLRNQIAWSLSFAVAAACGLPAIAAPIQFIYEGQIRGSLNGAAFPPTTFRFTAWGDTTQRQGAQGPGVGERWIIHSGTPSIEIAGVGVFDVLQPTQTYTVSWLATGFVMLNEPGFARDYWLGPSGEQIWGWDMRTSFGPFTGNLCTWNGNTILTSGGLLNPLTGAGTLGTFTAIVVPEPATTSLLVFGALAAAGALRRR